MAAYAVASPYFAELALRAARFSSGFSGYSELRLGETIYLCVSEAVKWQSGGNVNLGSLTLLVPLVGAFTIADVQGINSQNITRDLVSEVVASTTVEDSIFFRKSVLTVNPGGLASAEKYDLLSEDFERDVRRDNVSLFDLFRISASWDSISREWATGFKVSFEVGAPFFIETLRETGDVNAATVNTFLKILSEVPDSLITRKAGVKLASRVSRRAGEVLALGGLENDEGRRAVFSFDEELKKAGNRLNPGSTADLTASSIMVALNFERELPFF